jgi:hypothetical protein
VAHTYNPSNSGGRDQEDRGSKPARANSSQDSILKRFILQPQKRAGGVGQGVGPEFKPQYNKNKKDKNTAAICNDGPYLHLDLNKL